MCVRSDSAGFPSPNSCDLLEGRIAFKKTEPGICCRMEDFHGNENRKLRKNIFSVGKKINKSTFF